MPTKAEPTEAQLERAIREASEAVGAAQAAADAAYAARKALWEKARTMHGTSYARLAMWSGISEQACYKALTR